MTGAGGLCPCPLFPVFLLTWFVFLFPTLSWAVENALAADRLHASPILEGAPLVDELAGAPLPGPGLGGRPISASWTATVEDGWSGTGRHGIRLDIDGRPIEGGSSDLDELALAAWRQPGLPPVLAGLVLLLSRVTPGARQTASATLSATLIGYKCMRDSGLSSSKVTSQKARLICNTATPGVTTVRELDDLSLLGYDDDRRTIGYDARAAWPLTWYSNVMSGTGNQRESTRNSCYASRCRGRDAGALGQGTQLLHASGN